MSALNEYLKCTETWRTNGDKFQLLLSYVKPHVEVHSSTVSRWIKEILKEIEVDVDVLKTTLHVQPIPQKHVYQVFQ